MVEIDVEFCKSNPTDKSLFEERLKCKDLCFEYNNLKPSELEKRKEYITKCLYSPTF